MNATAEFFLRNVDVEKRQLSRLQKISVKTNSIAGLTCSCIGDKCKVIWLGAHETTGSFDVFFPVIFDSPTEPAIGGRFLLCHQPEEQCRLRLPHVDFGRSAYSPAAK